MFNYKYFPLQANFRIIKYLDINKRKAVKLDGKRKSIIANILKLILIITIFFIYKSLYYKPFNYVIKFP